ncbi:MAG: FG-GAP-like repeat-containing protein [Mycobacteriales bacterium]
MFRNVDRRLATRAAAVSAFALVAGLVGGVTAAPASAALPEPSFATSTTSNVNQGLLAVAADVNNDGNLDILSGVFNGGFYVKLGNGDGTFAAPVTTARTGTTYGVAVGDINRDGNLDLFVRSVFSSSLFSLPYFGNGDGTFTAGTPMTSAENGYATPVLADLDNDGLLDLILHKDLATPFETRIFRGDGAGNFTFVRALPATARYAFSPQVADLNQDGYLDLVLAAYDTGIVNIFNSDGAGALNFLPSVAHVISPSLDIAIGDVNGDSRLDIAYAGSTRVGALTYDTTTGAYVDGTIAVIANSQGTTLTDVNGDGSLDIGTTRNTGAGYLQEFYLNDGVGTFTLAATSHPSAFSYSQISADLNKDCRPDVLAPSWSARTHNVFLNTTTFPAPTVTAGPQSQAVSNAQAVTFSAAATSRSTCGSVGVQWQSSTDGTTFASIGGATALSFTFTAAYADSGKSYRAVFTDAFGSVNSASAALTVHAAPGVTNPADATVEEGQPASFTASGSGNTAPTAQWQVSVDNGAGWTDISGATADSYTIAAAALSQDQSLYRVVYSSVDGTTATSGARLTVTAKPAPAPVVTIVPPAPDPVPVAVAPAPVVYGAPTIGLAARTIQYGDKTTVSGSTRPGALVNVYGYTQPSTTYSRLGTVRADSTGVYTFTTRLAGNSRLYVVVPRLPRSLVVAQGVRSTVTLSATRLSNVRYAFTGNVAPSRNGQLVTIYVRTANGGKAILTRTWSNPFGNYQVSRTVWASGRQVNTVFAHVDSGVVLLGNNSRDQQMTTVRP